MRFGRFRSIPFSAQARLRNEHIQYEHTFKLAVYDNRRKALFSVGREG